jgi:hypothetical protein
MQVNDRRRKWFDRRAHWTEDEDCLSIFHQSPGRRQTQLPLILWEGRRSLADRRDGSSEKLRDERLLVTN